MTKYKNTNKRYKKQSNSLKESVLVIADTYKHINQFRKLKVRCHRQPYAAIWDCFNN